jgi:ABC-type nitrate/sulfonate/bicarbonate transport system substrate-binding protein
MKPFHRALPFRGRVALLIGIFGFAAGAALMSYQFYRRPVVLTLAVGSSDGAATQIASDIAGRLATTNSPIRLKVENVGTEVDAARSFAAGTADLAIVRADAGNLHDGRAVAVTARGVLTVIAPPGSAITDISRLRGHTVGVVGGEVNHAIVDVLTREYDLDHSNVVFRDIARQDARQALQSKAINALLVVAPLTEKHLAWIKSLLREGANSSPVLMQVDAAGAIADKKGPYEASIFQRERFGAHRPCRARTSPRCAWAMIW